jgi:carbonic anhydrase
LVLAVLLDTSTGIETPTVSNTLDTILNNYSVSLNQTTTVTGQFNPNNLLPIGNSPIVTYTGSLTTPPCTEGVIWYILGSPIQVSAAHIQAINSLIPNNNRFTQNTNGRTVQLHNHTSGGY